MKVEAWKTYGGKGSVCVASQNPECKVYVAGLPYSVTSSELAQIFSICGLVVYAKILRVYGNGERKDGVGANSRDLSKGAGMVEFSSEAEARNAVDVMNNYEVGGRVITVSAWTCRSTSMRSGTP